MIFLVNTEAFVRFASKISNSRGNATNTKGTCFVVYDDIFDAKNAVDHLSGFNVAGRYLIVLYYQANRQYKKTDTEQKADNLAYLKDKYGLK
jgi:pre-mRNA branch site protein p14